VILKDLDVRRKVHMTDEVGRLFIETLTKDVAFLQSQNVMDYSLLLAVCPDNVPTHNSHVGGLVAAEGFCTCCGTQVFLFCFVLFI
jgi:hypothetical protein